jgi:predicted lactoylglutathione lyase
MLKAGSMISMIENKKLNTAAFFALLLENKSYQEFFAEITSSNNFRDALLSMLYLNPSLVKSKVTKSTVRRIHNAKKSTQRPKN